MSIIKVEHLETVRAAAAAQNPVAAPSEETHGPRRSAAESIRGDEATNQVLYVWCRLGVKQVMRQKSIFTDHTALSHPAVYRATELVEFFFETRTHFRFLLQQKRKLDEEF